MSSVGGPPVRRWFSWTLVFVTMIIPTALGYGTRVTGQAQSTSAATPSTLERSIYQVIERVAGQRDFSATVALTFDVRDGNLRKVTSFKFDMQSRNLEVFTFHFHSPEVLRDISVTYDLIARRVTYRHGEVTISEPQTGSAVQVSSIVQSITDFLSTPVFDVREVKDEIVFVPKNAQILVRFGVQPVRVTLRLEKGLPKVLKITNGKEGESVTLEFEKFRVGP